MKQSYARSWRGGLRTIYVLADFEEVLIESESVVLRQLMRE